MQLRAFCVSVLVIEQCGLSRVGLPGTATLTAEIHQAHFLFSMSRFETFLFLSFPTEMSEFNKFFMCHLNH